MSTEPVKHSDAKALGEELGFSAEWVRDQCRKQGWPHQRYNGRIRFTPEQVEAILTLHNQKPDTTQTRTGRRRTHATRRRAA
jgi:hypothetical protein